MILSTYLRGKIQRTMVKGKENIGNRNYEQWKLDDCSTKAGSLKINTSSFL